MCYISEYLSMSYILNRKKYAKILSAKMNKRHQWYNYPRWMIHKYIEDSNHKLLVIGGTFLFIVRSQ